MVGSQKTILSKSNRHLIMIVLVLKSNSDEHQRRSPDCVFFACSVMAKAKVGGSKKGRASKTPRVSMQSNFTTVSEGASVADTDLPFDESVMSLVEPANTVKSGKGAKKSAKAKKPARSKRQASKAVNEDPQAASSLPEPEDDDFEVKVENTLAQNEMNRKRKSDAMDTANDMSNHVGAHTQGEEVQDQPRKRRDTRSRGSMAQTRNEPVSLPREDHEHDTQRTDAERVPAPAPPQGRKKGKGSNKRGSSNVRKTSTASTASKASLRATKPPDEELDAMLEAELDRPLTDDEGDIEPPATTKPKGRRLTRTKPGSRKATASIAPTRRTTRASAISVDASMQDTYPSLSETVEMDPVSIGKKDEEAVPVLDILGQSLQQEQQSNENLPPILEPHNGFDEEDEKQEESVTAVNDKVEEMSMSDSQQPESKQQPVQSPASDTRMVDIPTSSEAIDLTSDVNSSMLGTQTAQDDSGHESGASVAKQTRTKRGSKRIPTKRMKGGKKAAPISQNIEVIVRPIPVDTPHEEQGTDTASVDKHADSARPVSVEVEEEPKKQQKSSRATAKSGKTKKILPEVENIAPEESVALSIEQPGTSGKTHIARPSVPLSSAHSTPKPTPSPQSSDAENQPPSSCLSKPGPPVPRDFPLEPQTNRVPLAATTPISSPSRNNISNIKTIFPWTAIEVEHIFEGTPAAEKENDPFTTGKADQRLKSLLTSPEKKMTVEQWIQSNAQRGEEKLRGECERLVGKFEDQGVRALRVLEGIVCADRP